MNDLNFTTPVRLPNRHLARNKDCGEDEFIPAAIYKNKQVLYVRYLETVRPAPNESKVYECPDISMAFFPTLLTTPEGHRLYERTHIAAMHVACRNDECQAEIGQFCRRGKQSRQLQVCGIRRSDYQGYLRGELRTNEIIPPWKGQIPICDGCGHPI